MDSQPCILWEKRLASTEMPRNAQPTGFQEGADQQCPAVISVR